MANGRRIANTVTFPAPTGGWNARDALASMGKGDAVILDNFVPKTTEVVCVQDQAITSQALRAR